MLLYYEVYVILGIALGLFCITIIIILIFDRICFKNNPFLVKEKFIFSYILLIFVLILL